MAAVFRDPATGFSLARACWNHRTALAGLQDRISAFRLADGAPGSLKAHQCSELTAAALEFRPDLIVEVGSTIAACIFTEAANRLASTRVLSVSPEGGWKATAVRLREIVNDAWFAPLQVVETDIRTFDFRAALSDARRILVFWTAHGSDTTSVALARVLPEVAGREHLIAVHDIGDVRYHDEEGGGCFTPIEESAARYLEPSSTASNLEDCIALSNFAARNSLPLHSASQSLHTELNVEQAAELASAWSGRFSREGRWIYCSLSEAALPVTFPPLQAPCDHPSPELTAAPTRSRLPDAWHVLPANWHLVTLLLLPVLLYLVNPNWLFQNIGHMDSWVYFGEFQHFPRFQSLRPAYWGERMTWVFPGWVLTRLFGTVTAVMVLHIATYLVSAFSLYFVLRRLTTARTAFTAALMLGCHACFVASNGWDYPDSVLIALFLLSVLFLLMAADSRRPIGLLLISAAAWSGMVYSFLAWAIFTPGYLYAVYAILDLRKAGIRAVRPAAGSLLAGWLCATVALWGVYALLGGPGFFLEQNIKIATMVANLKTNPWLTDPKWYYKASWLILPVLAFCLAVTAAMRSAFRKPKIPETHEALLWLYAYCFAAMVILTIPASRVLAASQYDSVLLPGCFIVLGLTLLRPPESIKTWLFCTTLLVGCLVSLLPLARRELYTVALRWGLTVPVGLAISAAMVRVFNCKSAAGWVAAVLLLCGAGFGIVPKDGSPAWRIDYDGRDISRRVSKSIDLIMKRLPADKYPAFWINNVDDRLTAEYRGIMCAFVAWGDAMYQFPKADTSRVYPVGTRLFMLTQHSDVMPSASYILARSGNLSRFVSRDLVELGSTAYWITQVEVTAATLGSLRQDFNAIQLDSMGGWEPVPGAPTSQAGPSSSIYRRRRITVPRSGIYQFELRYRLPGQVVKFGQLAPGTNVNWLEESGPALSVDGEQVSWFRIAAKSGTEVDLAYAAASPTGPAVLDPGTAPSLSVLLENGDPSTSVFNFILEKPDLDENLVKNGSLDAEFERWDWNEGVAHPGVGCRAGACLEFEASGHGFQYLTHWFAATLSTGVTYEYGAWVKSGDSRPQPLEVGVWDPYASRWVARREITALPDWSEVKFTFKNDSSNPIATTFLKTTSGAGKIVVDEVYLKKGAAR